MPGPELVLIAAVARNGVIGDGQRMPWHLPGDLKFFADTTRGHPVIMGRRTWESLPPRSRPLPGRRNLVVTRDPGCDPPGAERAASLEEALQRLADAPIVFVIGGAQLYAQALPRADRLVLTEIDHDFSGDTHFPAWPREQFVECRRTQHDSGQGFGYAHVEYRRRH